MALIFGTQFTGTVNAGQTGTWFTHSWNAEKNVVWICVPTSPIVDGAAQIEWSVRSTRQAGNLLKWFITVRNVSSPAVPVSFQARYAILNG